MNYLTTVSYTCLTFRKGIALGLLACSIPLHSQMLDLGISAGVSLYQGDLTSYRLSDGLYLGINPAFGAKLRYGIQNKFALSASALFTRIEGVDSLSTDQANKNRNFDFHSSIFEVSLRAEWFPLGRYESTDRRIDLYLSSGVNFFRFNPKTSINGQEIELQPLGTEGQGILGLNPDPSYSLSQIAIPVGGGIRLRVTENVGLEGSFFYNYSFTDYLDDVGGTFVDVEALRDARGNLAADLSNRNLLNTDGSIIGTPGQPRANPSTKDAYLTVLLTLTFILNDPSASNKFCPSF